MDTTHFWQQCLTELEKELTQDTFNDWVLPLEPVVQKDRLKLLAPNRYVYNHVHRNLTEVIQRTVVNLNPAITKLTLDVGFYEDTEAAEPISVSTPPVLKNARQTLDPALTFEKHVEGKSNQLSRAAAQQVGENPGKAFNPLFIYGGVGLGKTHLMHAVGHRIIDQNPNAKVKYIRSEVFVQDMVAALKSNKMNDFKKLYRSLDALLIDDIQFFAGKHQSQEEFFHTFNELLEGQSQIILTSDRMPQAITGVEERLISRFSSGLTVQVEPPELETRVAILENKASRMNMQLSSEVAFFIANVVFSNVRDLEGALHRLSAYQQFTQRDIDTDLARDALKDLIIYKDRQLTTENIQRLVADYFEIRVADLLSKGRARTITRPRQMAMALCKEYTSLSLPAIGDSFGGRDHTTVIHACKKVNELASSDSEFAAAYKNLQKVIGG